MIYKAANIIEAGPNSVFPHSSILVTFSQCHSSKTCRFEDLALHRTGRR
jgi:hypothetical protein